MIPQKNNNLTEWEFEDAVQNYKNVKFGDWVKDIGMLNSYYAFKLFQNMSKTFINRISLNNKGNE